eukprot:GFUD01040449.1.p1 GENE.GFUD01040449.1~~GFUD01040449.1.p1  ORF type:complete len:350 (-),score=96.93 GFUD01040449.1:265-1314(-)
MGSSEKFCLRWNDFEANISGAFRELRDDKDFFDITLACDEEQVEAHKVILSACSPFFRTVLKRNKHQHPLVYLKGVRYPDLLAVLNFMYHGEVNVAQEELNSFLAVAEELKVKGLTQNGSGPNKPGDQQNRKPPAPPPAAPPKRSYQPPTPAKTAPPPAYQASTTHHSYQSDDEIQEVVPIIKSEPVSLPIPPPPTTMPSYHSPAATHQPNTLSLPHTDSHSHALAATEDYADYEGYDTGLNNSGYDDSIQIPGGDDANKDVILDSLIDGKMTRVLDDKNQYVWQCLVCGKSWIKKSKCSRHVETHIGGTDIQCAFCDSTYKNRPSLKCHMYAAHRNLAGQNDQFFNAL